MHFENAFKLSTTPFLLQIEALEEWPATRPATARRSKACSSATSASDKTLAPQGFYRGGCSERNFPFFCVPRPEKVPLRRLFRQIPLRTKSKVPFQIKKSAKIVFMIPVRIQFWQRNERSPPPRRKRESLLWEQELRENILSVHHRMENQG